LYRETALAPQSSYMTAKTHAIPSLHRDCFLPKVPGLCPDAASGNTTSLYCRAVMVNENIFCTLYSLKTLTITEKAKLLYRDNANPYNEIHYLDKFLLTRQLSKDRCFSQISYLCNTYLKP
jgi:hypothetical protein